ncbi:MAG: hypothetical protein CM1200mP1_08020 [Candidatus Neomarinimicrobiota bacterium]|nr:MAG: hypothetical protein CM1200mP1_08020 [Candidatus Neomarinimicrobiota bacterium]
MSRHLLQFGFDEPGGDYDNPVLIIRGQHMHLRWKEPSKWLIKWVLKLQLVQIRDMVLIVPPELEWK